MMELTLYMVKGMGKGKEGDALGSFATRFPHRYQQIDLAGESDQPTSVISTWRTAQKGDSFNVEAKTRNHNVCIRDLALAL